MRAFCLGAPDAHNRIAQPQSDTDIQPATPAKRKLPIGIQTFRRIREDDCYYVDKTQHLKDLVDGGARYFLSRPRRFGKSLLVDTLKELFEANEPLFRGLAVHGQWDWSVRHPVVRLDFSMGSFADPGHVHANVMAQLDAVQRETGAISDYPTAPQRLSHLLECLHQKSGKRVVVLVDEYDKPILDVLNDAAAAAANRSYLRSLYSTIKFADAHIEFALLTGVSKFTKVSLFSDLNNLEDITLDPRHATICGYTDWDVDTVFAPELPGLDRVAIREWYNGYGWLGEETVYNPFDVLLLFRTRRFAAHWFETGSPRFLVDMLTARGVSSVDLDGMIGSDELLSTFDVEHIATEALLFQGGYLTIVAEENAGGKSFYRLGYPNREVRQSLNGSLLGALVPERSVREGHGLALYQRLQANDFAGLEALLRAFFAGIPHQWHANNRIADYEGYYASVFHAYLMALELDVRVEDSSASGRLDMAVLFSGNVYLFEFKVLENASPGAALAQLEERDYAAKYRDRGEPIHLVGVEFSRRTRNLVRFEVGRA